MNGLQIEDEMACCQIADSEVLLENSEDHAPATNAAGALESMVFVLVIAVCYGL